MTQVVPVLRHRFTDPLAPAVLFGVAAVVVAGHGWVLTWAVVGGLAGYTLSGSV